MFGCGDDNSMTDVSRGVARGLARVRRIPFLLYGILAVSAGMTAYLCGILLVVPRYLFDLNQVLLPVNELIVWYSGAPVMLGIIFILIDLFLLLGERRRREEVRFSPIVDPRVTVALTAYNDEASIGPAVRDFIAHPLVRRVIVVSNNSGDRTVAEAQAAGAIVFNEPNPGYGQCVYRCWSEAMRYPDAELIALCEGDRTFRAYDLEKFLAYLPHADIVNGTRTVEPLRQYHTQLQHDYVLRQSVRRKAARSQTTGPLYPHGRWNHLQACPSPGAGGFAAERAANCQS